MATKTFSGRAEERDLAFANALAHEQLGISYGQYCGSLLIEALKEGASLPAPKNTAKQNKKIAALEAIKGFASHSHNPEIGNMSDSELKELIAGRYA